MRAKNIVRRRVFATLLSVNLLIIPVALANSTAQKETSSEQMVRKTSDELRSAAVTRVVPVYPPIANAARVSGEVMVEITVNELGDVISAQVISGHELLRDAAFRAARGWKFRPAQVNGKAVKVTGTISFYFDLEARKLYPRSNEINKRKQPILSPEDQEKLRRVEETADRFIQRWHETLDLNVLFDEMYVTNAKQRRQNAYLFNEVYKLITRSGIQPKVGKGIDEAVMKAGFMAFWNMFYLDSEYKLAFWRPGERVKLPTEIVEAQQERDKIELSKTEMTLKPIKEYIAKADHLSSLYRKYLSRGVFESPTYKANLERSLEWKNLSLRIMRGFVHRGVKDNVKVYSIQRGVFPFYFIEEEGKLKVLKLGFEL
jgi:TonB family protein